LLRAFIMACSTPVFPEATTDSAVRNFVNRRLNRLSQTGVRNPQS
jgi:hypothetical protein